jgi:RUN domain
MALFSDGLQLKSDLVHVEPVLLDPDAPDWIFRLYLCYFQMDSSSNLISSTSNRFYWIRIALFEKRLHKIVSYLTQNADRLVKNIILTKFSLWEYTVQP